jgi:hypothetical protein
MLPKLLPKIVRDTPPDVGPLSSNSVEMTGASNENMAADVPTIALTVSFRWLEPPEGLPGIDKQVTRVFVDQDEVEQPADAIATDGV